MKTVIKLIFSAFIFISLYLPFHASAQTADFTGRWLIDTAKSTFNGVPVSAAVQQFDIQQTGTTLHISRVTLNDNNVTKTTSEDDMIDSQPHAVKLNDQISKENTLSWGANGALLTVSKYLPTGQPDKGYTLTQTWTLLNGGRQLEVDLKTPTYSIKVIYNKQ